MTKQQPRFIKFLWVIDSLIYIYIYLALSIKTKIFFGATRDVLITSEAAEHGAFLGFMTTSELAPLVSLDTYIYI